MPNEDEDGDEDMPLLDKVTLWQSQTFTTLDGQRNLAVSSSVTNASYNSCKVFVGYEGLAPDGATELVGYRLQAILEEEAAPNVWTQIASQFVEVDESTDPSQHVIELSPGLIINPGVVEWVQANGQNFMGISRTEGTPGDKLRVVVRAHRTDPTRPDVTSVTLSGYLRLYNT